MGNQANKPAPAAATAAAPATTTPAAAARTITVLAAANPKKPGSRSHARFALYTTGQSVAAYQAACVALGQPHAKRNATADLTWDAQHGFIKLA